MNHIHEVFAVIGALYTIASVGANTLPKSWALTKWLSTAAAGLRKLEDKEPPL